MIKLLEYLLIDGLNKSDVTYNYADGDSN